MISEHRSRSLLLVTGVLAASFGIVMPIENDGQQTKATTIFKSDITNRTSEKLSELDTAPTITSVHHQYWASSSSGSLDELSPEVISKLRQDVPFLAAYALRPRLVGAIPTTSPTTTSLIELESGGSVSAPTTSRHLFDNSGAASSPRVARQTIATSGKTPINAKSLGDFSEFNFETSSLSKSEHHHRRKTSLKRQQQQQQHKSPITKTTSKRSASKRAARLDKKRPKKGSQGRGLSQKRSARGAKKRVNNNSRVLERLSAKSKRARLQADYDGERARINELDENSTSMQSKTSDKEGSVKGGSKAPANKKPFYASGQPKKVESGEDSESTIMARPNVSKDDRTDDDVKSVSTMMNTASDRNETINDDNSGMNEQDDENELDDEPLVEPKRVGDDDVEEDGDTVLVEPKSDGVDDDPDLPSSEEDAMEDEPEREGGASSSEQPLSGQDDQLERPTEADERGKRINRGKPNSMLPPPPTENDEEDDATGGGTNGGTAAGGGIGATTGIVGSGGDTISGGGRQKLGTSKESPGVEFANEDDGASRQDSSGSGGDATFGSRRKDSSGTATTVSGGNGSTTGARGESGERPSNNPAQGDEDDSDLDYRDELEEMGYGGRRPKGQSKGSIPNDGVSDNEREVTGARKDASREEDLSSRRPKTADGGSSKDKNNCDHDDGSYKPHDEKYHDEHHQTIDWLRGSIPGEPNDDYPILHRAINDNNFKCSQQKHPGYYADVEARCQIFHICQPGGQQDSFLCPNGTIFSQKTLVCVWWNGFDCED